MTTSTLLKRRFATMALIVGALTILAPVAQAQSGSTGSPDVIDRAVAARQAHKIAAIDARDRWMTERPTVDSATAPDAFERALITRADATTSRTSSILDRERAVGTQPVASPEVGNAGGFDWSDFGLAGVGIGFIVVILGIGIGVLAVRHGQGRVTNL